MSKKINVLGVEIDAIDQAELSQEVIEYLKNDYLNVIFFATVDMIERAFCDNEYKELLRSADFVLPGQEILVSACEPELIGNSDVFVGLKDLYMPKQMQPGNPEGVVVHSIYFIGKTKEQIEQLIDYTALHYPDITTQGIYCGGMEEKEEMFVNEINAAAPDILVAALDSPFQEKWIINNSTRLNAKLCIAIGGLHEISVFPEMEKTGGFFIHFMRMYDKFRDKLHLAVFQRKVNKYRNGILK